MSGGRHQVIGLTGLPCAGKGEVAAVFAQHGARCIDVDALGHAVLEEPTTRDALRDRFGDSIVGPDGRIDRSALGAIVFSEDTALRDLEALVHPPLQRLAGDRIAAAREEAPVVVDAALLGPLALDALCDAVLLVEAPWGQRLSNATKRGWSEYDLNRRDPRVREGLQALAHPNVRVLTNDTSLQRLHESAASFWKEWIHGEEENRP